MVVAAAAYVYVCMHFRFFMCASVCVYVYMYVCVRVCALCVL